jgi:hypothetical protein
MRNADGIVRLSAAEIDERLARGEDLTDWARVDAMTESELWGSIDWAEEGFPDRSTAYLGIPGMPGTRTLKAVYVDQDVYDWFAAREGLLHEQVDKALRAHIAAQNGASSD